MYIQWHPQRPSYMNTVPYGLPTKNCTFLSLSVATAALAEPTGWLTTAVLLYCHLAGSSQGETTELASEGCEIQWAVCNVHCAVCRV